MYSINQKNNMILKCQIHREMVKNRRDMAVFGGNSVSSQFHIVQFIPITLIIPKEILQTLLKAVTPRSPPPLCVYTNNQPY